MKMKYKQDSPKVKKIEETTGKDVDHDGEKGESPAHKSKMKAAAMKMKGSGKMCTACKKAGKSFCTHM
jgi:hypothetical protein